MGVRRRAAPPSSSCSFAAWRVFALAMLLPAVSAAEAAETTGEPVPEHAVLSSATKAAIDTSVREAMQKQHVPGMALAVVENGTIVFAGGYGVADRKSGVAVTPQTQFQIGSITKQFMGAAILQAVAAGQLSFNDRVAKFYPDYAAAARVSVRDLLEQVSGVPEYLTEKTMPLAGRPTTVPAVVALVAAKPLDFAPGTQWEYSNTNYVLLGGSLNTRRTNRTTATSASTFSLRPV